MTSAAVAASFASAAFCRVTCSIREIACLSRSMPALCPPLAAPWRDQTMRRDISSPPPIS
jgi:hypothetical protein